MNFIKLNERGKGTIFVNMANIVYMEAINVEEWRAKTIMHTLPNDSLYVKETIEEITKLTLSEL